jgi:hypothetical protein
MDPKIGLWLKVCMMWVSAAGDEKADTWKLLYNCKDLEDLTLDLGVVTLVETIERLYYSTSTIPH